MTRPLRLEFAGALYHVTSRGDRQDDIYENNVDRDGFLSVLGGVCATYNWVCHAYCLMSNHYHLLIETPDANLSKGMRQLNGVYTQSFNRRHGRVGHVFQGRYKAIHVDREEYLLELARYIVLNPVRAKMVRSAKDWPWSSYRSTTGQSANPAFLNTQWLLAAFGKNKGKAIEGYKQFVARGKNQPSPWKDLRNQVYLGDDSFVKRMDALIDGDKDLSEVPSSQRRGIPASLEEYDAKYERNEAIEGAYTSGGYTLKEIGDYFGLHYATVSRLARDTSSKT
jgi:putative transposase